MPNPFGRYQIVRVLGSGGMGAVYLAHDTQLDRPVALKVPRKEVARNAEIRQRFLREARAAARFHHPNFCPIFDIGEKVEDTLMTNTIGMKLKLIPAGEFLMGAQDDEPLAEDDEKPRHRVRITRPFYLGVYEVTQAEYRAVMGTNPSHFSADGRGKDKVAGMDTARFPVENVSWNDAIAFCDKLSERDGLKPYDHFGAGARSGGDGYRLPTEAEWEYACRAGTVTAFAFGDRLSPTEANFNGNYVYNGSAKGPYLERPSPVGSYRPNAFGLFDMHGNVWELCSDFYEKEYYEKSPIDNLSGPSKSADRVDRGGSWSSHPLQCRSVFRFRSRPDHQFDDLGFRVARVRSGP